MAKILLLNGPNLNLLGEREPDIYGQVTLGEIEKAARQKVEEAGHSFWCFQSNHEGEMVEWLHKNRPADFLLINAAAFTHTSVAIRDAVSLVNIPFIEIHLSNLYQREPFRQKSFLSDLALGMIVGLGAQGYDLAVRFALDYVDR